MCEDGERGTVVSVEQGHRLFLLRARQHPPSSGTTFGSAGFLARRLSQRRRGRRTGIARSCQRRTDGCRSERDGKKEDRAGLLRQTVETAADDDRRRGGEAVLLWDSDSREAEGNRPSCEIERYNAVVLCWERWWWEGSVGSARGARADRRRDEPHETGEGSSAERRPRLPDEGGSPPSRHMRWLVGRLSLLSRHCRQSCRLTRVIIVRSVCVTFSFQFLLGSPTPSPTISAAGASTAAFRFPDATRRRHHGRS